MVMTLQMTWSSLAGLYTKLVAMRLKKKVGHCHGPAKHIPCHTLRKTSFTLSMQICMKHPLQSIQWQVWSTCYNSREVICPLFKKPTRYYCTSGNIEGSSVVHVVIEDTPKFGIITRLFRHTYRKVVKWATITWYPHAILEEESHIWYTLPYLIFDSPLPLKRLSKPHVTAWDDGKLWILNCTYPTYTRNTSAIAICVLKEQTI